MALENALPSVSDGNAIGANTDAVEVTLDRSHANDALVRSPVASSPASYWIFNYLFDLFISTIWFCYLLAIYCLVDVAFNGAPKKTSALESISSLVFGTPWDLRVQFYPLSILIAIPTLPFAYLLTKLFRSDILVRTLQRSSSRLDREAGCVSSRAALPSRSC